MGLPPRLGPAGRKGRQPAASCLGSCSLKTGLLTLLTIVLYHRSDAQVILRNPGDLLVPMGRFICKVINNNELEILLLVIIQKMRSNSFVSQ